MDELDVLKKDGIQANPLIEARKHMNLTEMRLFGLGLSDIALQIKDNNVQDVDFHDTWITYSDLVKLFASNNGGNIANLKKQTTKAYQSFIRISNEDGGFTLRHIYEEMAYYPRKGLLIRFHDKLKPYILELAGKAYTVYKLNLLFLLSSEYSQRLMELLLEKQGHLKKQDRVFRELSLEELREKLNVPDGKYKNRIDNFKFRVLDEPIREINQKTDYLVWYDVKKQGRRITGFKIWMKFKDRVDANKVEKKQDDLKMPVPKDEPEELDAATVETILKLWQLNGKEFTPAVLQALEQRGYTKATFMRRYCCFE